MKHREVTGKILGAAFEVHNTLGSGFQEVVYQRALAYELQQRDLQYARETAHDIYYKNLPSAIGQRRVDFVVEGKVLIELKAIVQLEMVHWAQTLNYLRVFNYEVGLLINFGNSKLEYKRLVL